MPAKTILQTLIFSAFLIGVILALPTSFNDDDLCNFKNFTQLFASTGNDTSLKPTQRFTNAVMRSTQQLISTHLKKAYEVSVQLLQDPIVVLSQLAEVEQLKENLKEFQKQYTKCSSTADVAQLMHMSNLYANATMVYYEKQQSASLSENEKLIYDILRSYSSKDLDHEVKKAAIEKMEEKINEMREDLQQDPSGLNLLQFWDQLMKMKTTDEKLRTIKELVIIGISKRGINSSE